MVLENAAHDLGGVDVEWARHPHRVRQVHEAVLAHRLQVPARRIAAVRYSGFWSEQNYLRYKLELESWIKEKGFTSVGDPIWARYNPPYTPWFFRRNEILIPINIMADQEKAQ